MRLDAGLLFAFLAIFTRCTAMLMASPIYGAVVPIQIRVMLAGVISMALVPVVGGSMPPPPTNEIEILLLMGREAMIGLLIGGCVQLLLSAFQMAGTILDLQIGIGSAQIFNPMVGTSATPIGQFKFLLGLVLVLVSNGHHAMFGAFVESYHVAGGSLSMSEIISNLTSLVSQMLLLALQIAAPVAAVTVVIDIASGLVNKAVPQTQPFLIALPAKLSLGMIALAVGLPALVAAVSGGLDITFQHVNQMLGAR